MSFSVDELVPLYEKHGLNLRKHTGEHPAWTKRVKTIVDLDDRERAILESEGERALDTHLRETGMFAVPALDIRRLKPRFLATVLAIETVSKAVIFVGPDGPLCDVAGAICEIIRSRGGPAPEVHSGTEFDLLDLAASHAIILGGAHENPAAATLCDRGWLDADRRFPGPGGWMIRTVHNIAGLAHNVLHFCADETNYEQALDCLRERIVSRGRSLLVDPVLEIHPSEEMRERLGTWEQWKHRLAEVAFRAHGLDYREIEDVEAYGRWLAECFDCGGVEKDYYNRHPMAAATMAARLFLYTADERYLRLFRQLTLSLVEYHCNFPDGASYLADYDFAVYSQIMYWDLLEEYDVFSDEERLIITNFLLSSARMCEGHLRAHNPRPGALRHNHTTFAALSTFMGGRYFGDYYDIDDAEDFLAEAEMVFTGPIEDRVKHLEDANLYQWIVPRHKLIWDFRNGVYTYRDNRVMEGLAHHIVATTDNIGWPSDFGDAGAPISGGGGIATLLEVIAGHLQAPDLQWWAEKIMNAVPGTDEVSLPGSPDLPGSCRVAPEEPAPPPVADVVPLEQHVHEKAAPEFPLPYLYDKIALRDGFDPQDAYLLLDGYSVGSHVHYDQNAIIRYTAAERLWLVDNGYGKPSGETGAQAAYSGREVGPQDHNTLLVIGEDGELALPPPLCALLTEETDGDLTLVQSALVGYAGVDWLRSIFWLSGAGALIVDQVNALQDVPELRCQLNMLGAVSVEPGLLTCAQKGATMHLQFEPSATVETRQWTNASWDDEFARGAYPYADLPLTKFERVASVGTGSTVRFVTLISAGPHDEPLLSLAVDGDLLTVNGPLPTADASIAGVALSAMLTGGGLSVALSPGWPVPSDIPRLPAKSERYNLMD